MKKREEKASWRTRKKAVGMSQKVGRVRVRGYTAISASEGS